MQRSQGVPRFRYWSAILQLTDHKPAGFHCRSVQSQLRAFYCQMNAGPGNATFLGKHDIHL